MIKTLDKLSLFASAGHDGIQGRLQAQFGLLARLPLTKVPQALTAPHVSWAVVFADAPQHPPRGLQEGQQALRPMLLPVPAGLCLLRVIDGLMARALQGPRTAGGGRGEPTARLPRAVGGRLDRLHCAISGRLSHNCPLTTDPGEK